MLSSKTKFDWPARTGRLGQALWEVGGSNAGNKESGRLGMDLWSP